MSSKGGAAIHGIAWSVFCVLFPRTADVWKKKSLNPFTSWQRDVKILTLCWKTERFPCSETIASIQSVQCF